MQARITYYIGFCLGCSKVNSYTSSSTCAAAAPPSLRYHIMRVALPHALFLPCCCPLPSAENFKSSFAFCVYSHLYYIFLLLLLLLLLRFSCFLVVFFFLPLPCFSLILHPRRDAKWAITARFDCGPDVLNGSDVRIAIAILHWHCLTLKYTPNNSNNLSSYPSPTPYSTVCHPPIHTAQSVRL